MTAPIRTNISTPLEAEYKERVKLTSRDNMSPNSAARQTSLRMPEDVVTLSSSVTAAGEPPRLKPSLPVTPAEKQALQVQFSVYG